MIEIITKDGISLDLSPDAEFEIEIENPMLDDSHIPVPFSTAISFLPTLTNKKVFGYIGAMMLEPSVKKIPATIFSGGIPLISGTLIYDGIENKTLNYTFSAKNVEQEFGGYIHEVAPIPIIGDNYPPTKVLEPLLNQIKDDFIVKDFTVPMIVNANEVAKEDAYLVGTVDGVASDIKYRNYYWDIYASISPVVMVSAILRNINIEVNETQISDLFNTIGILALHREIGHPTGFIRYGSHIFLDIKRLLPECTMEDLLNNVLKIICGSIFLNKDSYVLFGNSELLESKDIYDWDDKVSDVYSLSSEEGMLYDFGYKEESTGNDNFDKTQELASADNYQKIIEAVTGKEEYVAIKRTDTGCVYSGKTRIHERTSRPSGTIQTNYPYFDVIYRADSISSKESDEGMSTYNARSDFKLVKCIPVRTTNISDRLISERDSVCPVIEFPKLDGSRPKDVYVGIVSHNQFTDSGRIFTQNGSPMYADEINSGLSLLPDEVYDKYHRTFAEWISKDKQLISAEFNLSAAEISNFRIWKKVMIRSRLFVIKKATVTLQAKSDAVSFRCDLLSL